jgi:GDP-L-fucose synthase
MSYGNSKTGILGADGFLGRNLVAYFRRQGWPFVAVGRAAGDLSDAAACDRAFLAFKEVERIFHVVTFQRTGNRQYEIPADLLTVNARTHLNVLSAWARTAPHAKLISTGSSCFYPESDAPLTEAAFQSGPLHKSVRGYGLAKTVLAMGSQLYAEQYNLRYLHCVLATLYGPQDHLEPDRSHFIGAMLFRAMQEQKQGKTAFSVWGDPATVRDCLYVDDQIEAIMAAERKFENRILNCTGNRPVTVGEVAEAILAALQWNVAIEYPAGTFRGTSYKTVDSSDFLAATGWQSKVSLLEGLKRTADSLTKQGLA